MSEIYSMTGYASLRGSVRDTVAFTLAMKSVNHRFLDLNLRLPSYCDGLEVQMRQDAEGASAAWTCGGDVAAGAAGRTPRFS